MKLSEVKILPGRILIDPVEVDKKTEGGIILPSNINKKPTEGEVVVRGNSLSDVEMEIKEGDKVVFNEGAGNEVKINDKEYLLMEQRHVLYFIRLKR